MQIIDILQKRREGRKYNSIWQVLNASNVVEEKYDVIERLIDGIQDQTVIDILEGEIENMENIDLNTLTTAGLKRLIVSNIKEQIELIKQK